jgi:hypothetical protein
MLHIVDIKERQIYGYYLRPRIRLAFQDYRRYYVDKDKLKARHEALEKEP